MSETEAQNQQEDNEQVEQPPKELKKAAIEEDEYGWDDITQMTQEQIREELVEQRKRFESMERDLFKAQTAARKLSAQVKSLQELNSKHGVTHNNTSSAFTLPSEFKKLWDELVTELILDAFPDFLDQYKLFVCLVQELFIVVRKLILDTKQEMVIKIAKEMQLIGADADLNSEEAKQAVGMLQVKLQSVFKDYSTQIFSYETEKIKQFIETEYKPKCEGILSGDDDAMDMFEDNVGTPDFIRFVQAIIKLQLHMVLNDPPIELSMLSCQERESKTEDIEKFEFWMFNKNDYYCIDGFPREGYPCVVVLPPPYRQGYVYQGIKPAVIVLSDDNQDDMLMDHVHVKQQAVLEKLKQKRASSLATVKENVSTVALDEETKNSSSENQTINIKKIEVPKAPKVEEFKVVEKDKVESPQKLKTTDEGPQTTVSVTQQEEPKVFDRALPEVEDPVKSQQHSEPDQMTIPEVETEDKITVEDAAQSDSKEQSLSMSSDVMKDDIATKEVDQQPIATENGDDETVVRESGPLELNEPRVSKLNTDSVQLASLNQRNEEYAPDMIELPVEVIKSSRTKVVEVNLPPRGSARQLNSNRELSSPSPQFQSRCIDRKVGETEEEDQLMFQATQAYGSSPDKEPAPAPSVNTHQSHFDEERLGEHQADQSIELASIDNQEEEGSYTKRLENTEKRNNDFSDSRQYTVESQEGGVQEIQGGLEDDSSTDVRMQLQRQMKNLAESFKGRMGLIQQQQKEGPLDYTAHQQQIMQQQQQEFVPVSSKRNIYEMPKRLHDSGDDENIENVNSSANKKYNKMFSPSNVNNSPYFQSSKFSMQAARNQVNASTTSISNVYKRDRSSSNNARRPPMPTSSSLVSYNQSCPTTNSPHQSNSLVSKKHQLQVQTMSNPHQHQQINSLESHYSNQTDEVVTLPSNASIIAEMHYQKGMTDIKQDLQRKIVSYHAILKKTYAQADKEKQAKKKNSAVAKSRERDSSGPAKATTPASNIQNAAQKRKLAGGQTSTLSSQIIEQRCQPSRVTAQSSVNSKTQPRTDKAKRTSSKEKGESLDQLKRDYFAKMQAVTKKLDSERVVASHHHRREDSQSRSKSPMQPWKNMPRQMPSSMKDVYVPAAASIPVNRKSLSRGKGGLASNPAVGNKQVSIKQGLKTTLTANSGQFFHNGSSNPNINAGKNTVASRNGKNMGNKRSSIYASSDSSDDILRGGDLRRGSAPMPYEKGGQRPDHEAIQLQPSGQQRRKQQHQQHQQAASNTYVFTSDSSYGDQDSESDSEGSVDVNQRAGVYQPASHLRKAINVKHNAGKVPSGGGPSKTTAKQTMFSHVRQKSQGKPRDTSNNARPHSKSSTRAKHGIQSVQNRTAAAAGGIADRKVHKQTSAKEVNQTQVHGYQGLNFFNTGGSEKPNSLIQNPHQSQTYLSSGNAQHQHPSSRQANPNRTVQQISNKSLGNGHQNRQQLHEFVSPTNQRVSSKHAGIVQQPHNTIDAQLQHRNFQPQGHHFNQQNRSSGNLLTAGNTQQHQQQQHLQHHQNQQQHHNQGQSQHQQAAASYQPIYNLRSQAQINMLENHRLTESNTSNTSAFERVVNPVNDLYQPRSTKSGAMTNATGYTEARSRHSTALVNNYV